MKYNTCKFMDWRILWEQKQFANTHLQSPPFEDIQQKYYYLITLLLFEYNPSGYYEDKIRILGFNEAEFAILNEVMPYFYIDDEAIRIDDFDYYVLTEMISFLTPNDKEMLIDHIVLSSIDNASDIETLLSNIKMNICKSGSNLPLEYYSELDFYKFFKGKESTFMDEYYPSKELKDEIRLQYTLGN